MADQVEEGREYVKCVVSEVAMETTTEFALTFPLLPGRALPTQLWVPKKCLKEPDKISKGMVDVQVEIDKEFAQRHHMLCES